MKPLCVVLVLMSFLVGCAEPKFASALGAAHEASVLESKLNCDLKFKSTDLCLMWFWENKPTSTTDYGSLIFKTYRLNHFDSTPIEVDLETSPQLILWMGSMGHGSAPTTTEKLDTGTYRAKNVLFVMPGDWQLRFKTTTAQGFDDEVTSEIIF